MIVTRAGPGSVLLSAAQQAPCYQGDVTTRERASASQTNVVYHLKQEKDGIFYVSEIKSRLIYYLSISSSLATILK